MDYCLTLVASGPPLTGIILQQVSALAGVAAPPRWLSQDKAADLSLTHQPDRPQIEALWERLAEDRIDVFITTAQNRRKSLLIADMDATIVTTETLDELAAYAGLYDRIAAITARAMRGELDFAAALRERVDLLKGLGEQALHETLERTALTDGAEVFVRTMAAHGAICVLVSGGFTFFTGPVAERAGFHHHHGNILDIQDGKLSGTVSGPVLDKMAKRGFLESYRQALGLERNAVMAIGDGANDLPMLQEAGLGIGYRPKPAIREACGNCILHGDLTAALYAQGYRDSDFFTGR